MKIFEKIKCSVFKKLLQHCVTATLPFCEAHSALIHPLNDLKVIEVPISQAGLTRITVKGDRISNVFGIAGEYVMEPDEDQGQVFIRPLEPALNPISLTLTTEGGHTQDLRLVPQNQSPEALILQEAETDKSKTSTAQTINRNEISRNEIARNEIEDLLYACSEDRIPVGYHSVNLEITDPNDLHLLIREITNDRLRGLTFEVENYAEALWFLSESEFAAKLNLDVVAVLMPKKLLKPGERMHVYVAARSI